MRTLNRREGNTGKIYLVPLPLLKRRSARVNGKSDRTRVQDGGKRAIPISRKPMPTSKERESITQTEAKRKD